MRYVRTRKDGTREVVIYTGSDAPIWLEGEPAWHHWLILATYGVALPAGLVVFVVGALLGWW